MSLPRRKGYYGRMLSQVEEKQSIEVWYLETKERRRMINHNELKSEAEKRAGERVGEAYQDCSKGNVFLSLRLYIILLGSARKRLQFGGVTSGLIPPDPIYRSRLVSMLIFKVMRSGRRGLAKRIVYRALSQIYAEYKGEKSVYLPLGRRGKNNKRPSLEEQARLRREELARLEFFRCGGVDRREPGDYGVVPREFSLFRPKDQSKSALGDGEVTPLQAPARVLSVVVHKLIPKRLVKRQKARGKRRRGRARLVPYFVTRQKGMRVALGWIVSAARRLSGRLPFYVKLHRIIDLTHKGKGPALKALRDLEKLVRDNTFKVRFKRRVKRSPPGFKFRRALGHRSLQEQF